jgi:hypothetical protein
MHSEMLPYYYPYYYHMQCQCISKCQDNVCSGGPGFILSLVTCSFDVLAFLFVLRIFNRVRPPPRVEQPINDDVPLIDPFVDVYTDVVLVVVALLHKRL